VSKQDDFVNKLLKWTQGGKISWDINDYRFHLGGDERVVGKSYISHVEDEIVRIYSYDTKIYSDVDEYVWDNRLRLEIIDNDGRSKWEFQSNLSFSDLYRSVQFKAEGVGTFIEKFLSKEDS
jgi:hypothetical protein